MEGHVALVTHQLLVGVLLAPAQTAGAHAAQLPRVVLAVLTGGPALPWTWEGGVSSGRTTPPPPRLPSRHSGQDQNSLLTGVSTKGLPSPGRSILKTSSTKMMRQSLRESSLRETSH